MEDFILNGVATGDVASTMLRNEFDVGMMRPYIDEKSGRSFITRNEKGKDLAIPVNNANASLLRLEWTILDEVVVRASLPRLKAVANIRGHGLQFSIPNGMAKTVLDTQAQSDVSAANISMDGIQEGKADRPIYSLAHLPLPIIHKDFSFSARQIAVSRNGGMPLDLTMAELAARRVAEGAEQLLLGTAASYSYGGGTVYGLTNFPNRITYSLSSPLASAWIPRLTLLDVLAMRLAAQQHLHYGPYVLYVSLAWDRFLDDDFSTFKGDGTLRDRLRKVEGVEDVVTLDYLNGYDFILVQMTSDTVREVVGMDITTVQWETHGGMQLNFKVMAILVPQIRADFNGNCGVVHGAVSGQTTAPAGQQLLLPNQP